MSSQAVENQSAEERFRQAFERLKAGEVKVLKRGAPVTQNNVAREAGCKDPGALKKKRFPTLVGEIQAYVQLHPGSGPSVGERAKKQRAKKSAEKRLEDMRRQRDQAQSTLASANMRILELLEEVQDLHRKVEEFQRPPTRLGR